MSWQQWHETVAKEQLYRELHAGFNSANDATHKGHIMPRISEMIESKYLKQSDLGDDEEMIVTVGKVGKANIARDDEQPEYKWLIRFDELPKPMVLNSTNIQLLSKACDSEDTDDWIGKQVMLYVDHNVSYGGKLVGGLRVRPAKRAPKPAAKPKAGGIADMDDDVPFANPYRGRFTLMV